MAIHLLHPVTINTTQIDGITDVSISHGNAMSTRRSDGVVDARAGIHSRWEPVITVTGHDIAAILGAVGIAGVDTAFTCYDAKVDGTGAKASGSNHVKHYMANAAIHLGALSASHDDLASLSFLAHGYGSDPLTSTKLHALSAYSVTLAKGYIAHSVVINSDVYTGLQTLGIDFGIITEAIFSDAAIYPQAVAITSRAPRITFSSVDPTSLGNLTDGSGEAVGVNNAVIYLAKLENGRIASSGHISFTFYGGRVYPTGVAGEPRIASFECIPLYSSGQSTICTVNTSATLP